VKLNLGCADVRIDGFIGIDIAPGPADDQVVDLEGPWPWPDSSVDEVRAHDVAEHIGDWHEVHIHGSDSIGELFTLTREITRKRHPLGRIHFMNELHRVLMPGGRAEIIVPDALSGAGFIQDPTHKMPWTMNSLQYFGAGPGGDFAWNRLAKAYGITARFQLVAWERREYQDTFDKVWKLKWVLEAIK
jgi:hypothetical protein